jgi:hypothetical protein
MKLYIPHIDSYIEYFTENEIPGTVTIQISYKNIEGPIFVLDERKNQLNVGYTKNQTDLFKDKSDYIIDKFEELKESDFRHGSLKFKNNYEYEPTIHIFAKDFFNYLKQINRENNIDKIINT